MRVAFNAMFLDPGVSGGTETYVRALVPALATERPDLELTVLTTGRGARALHADGLGEAARILALDAEEGQRLRRLRAEQLTVPRACARRGIDVVHSLGNTGPLRSPVAHVLTVLDVHFFTTGALPPLSAFAFRQLTSRAARAADGLIAISEAARREVSEVLQIAPERFTVTPLGPGREPSANPLPAGVVRARHGLDGATVVLNVAAKRPHKNQELLLRALPALPPESVVVLAGHPEGYDRRLRTLAGELGVTERVRFLDDVDDAELEGLWAVAGCAAFPTRSEGFGLPVLEAMRRGVPVACSDLDVLHEVGGDVPAYFGPDDPAGAAAAIARALADERAPDAGRARAARFTWAHTAQLTAQAYERALG